MNSSKPIQPICFCIHRSHGMAKPQTIQDPALARSLLNHADTLEVYTSEGDCAASRLTLVVQGIRGFIEKSLHPDSPALADVAVLSFSDTVAAIYDFSVPQSPLEIPALRPDGTSFNLSYAANTALDHIENRIRHYQNNNRHYLRPILVIVGAISGSKDRSEEALRSRVASRCQSMISGGSLEVLAFDTSTRNMDLSPLQFTVPGAKTSHIHMEQIPEVLKNLASSAAVPPKGNAEPYILGIFPQGE